jgi:hypothetical protein
VFSESIGMLFKAVVQHLIGTEIEEGAGHDFLGRENPYSPYGHAQNSRGRTVINSGHIFQEYWHVFQGIFTAGFFVQSWQILGTNFEDSPYSIYCWDSRTVYRFLGQKSRSFSGQF